MTPALGDPTPLPSNFTSEDVAIKVVKEGARESMAHVLRAVEKIAHDYERHGPRQPGRYLRIKVKETKYLDKRAIVYIGVDGGKEPGPHPLAQIYLMRSLSTEDKRLCIAHELGHVLMAFQRRREGESFPQQFGPTDEEWCTEFADHVCKILNFFYTDTAFQAASRFPTKSVSPEEKERYRGIFAAEIRSWADAVAQAPGA